MRALISIVTSSIGRKVIMALSGLGLILFVIIHAAGNLQIFLGQEAFNAYAAQLKAIPAVLWTARAGLFAFFAGHIVMALGLTRTKRAARSTPYAVKRRVQLGYAARTVLTSGLVIWAFVAYHLMHFTLGVTDPALYQLTDAQGRHDVYSMVVYGFQNLYVASAYIIAMLLLGAHLIHGTSSLWQSLGFNYPNLSRVLFYGGRLVTAAIIGGFISIPVSVQLGWLTLPVGGL